MNTVVAVNGRRVEQDVAPSTLLVEFLRENMGLTGTKIGCETSVCGACTVLVDGAPVKSCTMLVAQADGSSVSTIEGLAETASFARVREAFEAEHGVQCGFCTPGIVASVTALISDRINPTDEEILTTLDGHLCRCTGYVGIVRAVRYLAAIERGEVPVPSAGTALAEPLAVRFVDSDAVSGADVEVV
jgi:carbon-monoxide dehydrogenase small subunit